MQSRSLDMEGPNFNSDDVEILEKRLCYEGRFSYYEYRLKHRLIGGEWGSVLIRECLEKPDSVGVLLYDPYEDSVVLIEQFRVGALSQPEGPWQLELVAGNIDPGETLEQAAHREAIEESGVDIIELMQIGDFLMSPGTSDEKMTLFCGGIDARKVGGKYGVDSEGEDIWAQVYPRSEVFAALQEGYVKNAPLIIALQWLNINHKKIQEKWQ